MSRNHSQISEAIKAIRLDPREQSDHFDEDGSPVSKLSPMPPIRINGGKGFNLKLCDAVFPSFENRFPFKFGGSTFDLVVEAEHGRDVGYVIHADVELNGVSYRTLKGEAYDQDEDERWLDQKFDDQLYRNGTDWLALRPSFVELIEQRAGFLLANAAQRVHSEQAVISELRLNETHIIRAYTFNWCDHIAQLFVYTQSGKASNTSVSVSVSREGVFMQSIYNVSTVNDPEFVQACLALNDAPSENRQFLRLLESRIAYGMMEVA